MCLGLKKPTQISKSIKNYLRKCFDLEEMCHRLCPSQSSLVGRKRLLDTVNKAWQHCHREGKVTVTKSQHDQASF